MLKCFSNMSVVMVLPHTKLLLQSCLNCWLPTV